MAPETQPTYEMEDCHKQFSQSMHKHLILHKAALPLTTLENLIFSLVDEIKFTTKHWITRYEYFDWT